MRTLRITALAAAFVAGALAGTAFGEASGPQVTFEVNDAFVRGKALPGVKVDLAKSKEGAVELSGVTGANGKCVVAVPAGTWFVTYRLEGYVAILRSETEIREDTRVVTASLSMSLEREGRAGDHRIRIILNWGSRPDQVQDADAHALCPCTKPSAHIYYMRKHHPVHEHEVTLDVDDRDWGGPETITFQFPPEGDYRYFVHSYSGLPARLGNSDVVVRLLVDDNQVGEFRPPSDAGEGLWCPFKCLRVSAGGDVSVVPFDEAELKAGEDRKLPADFPSRERDGLSSDTPPDSGATGGPAAEDGPLVGVILAVLIAFAAAAWVVIAKFKKARSS